ncbi:MAG: iron-containing alcohol dehydrogenase [Acholeplasmatales bacterium]|nr:iron-containing alcohol dehydrogenase [Acholeplasmatales bacterium]
MLNFIYNTPTKVYFGKDEELNIGSIIKEYGFKKILFHYGQSSLKKSGLFDIITAKLRENGIDYVELGGVEPNPKLSLVEKGIEILKREKVDMILAVGGGSVIDSAKSIAVGCKVDFSPWLFNIKKETPKEHIPVGVILTLSASGSDMSNSCVITNDTTWQKTGFNSELNRPLFAILDPKLTYTVSKYQTACGVVDIMMHTLERFFSKGDNDTTLTDNLALGLLKTVYKEGIVAINEPTNYQARANLMWANSISHNGLTHCGREFLMSVHQLEHELSATYDNIAHGAGLAVLWPSWALKAYKAQPDRFLRFAYEVMEVTPTDNKESDIINAINKLKAYYVEIGMPAQLREFGVTYESLEPMALRLTNNKSKSFNDIINVDFDMALEIYKAAY